MPLLKRKAVPLIPTPNLDQLEPDAQVFFLKATGEIFLDYDDYANRLSYLLCRIFQCEHSGKSSLDYFAALESEKAESRVVRERFPDELKGRVLATVQFQVMGRLDTLIELVFDRYVNRYFANEKVFVDLSGDKYFARISKVFPPANIRAATRAANAANSAAASSSTLPLPAPHSDTEDYTAVAHKMGTDLNVSAEDAKKKDDPDEYLYTVQLMDEEHKFEGSFMEVKGKQLSRDRLAFSKSILKRYIRECVQRDAPLASPWIVKPSIASQFGISSAQSEEREEINKKIREGKLAKRRKAPKDEEGASPVGGPAKKRKKNDLHIKDKPASRDGTPAHKVPEAPKKPIKYPIEDLDLDPMSIHDGRVLRRVNAELPSLPPKPVPSRDLLVPIPLFDSFITVWNALNVFSKPLYLSTFSLDDFAAALRHPARAPRCVLLAEIHASITNLIATDNSRVLGTTGANPIISAAARAEAEENGEPIEVDEEELEFDRLIRKGIGYSRRWDRSAKLKSADGREGWERHLIGAMCQRGGPVSMENLKKILAHLFANTVDTVENGDGAPVPSPSKKKRSPPAPEAPIATAAEIGVEDMEIDELELPDEELVSEMDPAELEDVGPSEQYYSLALEEKLEILEYLVTLAMGTKIVRAYIDDSESQLTEYRKQRADVNKERKALAEQKAILDGKTVKSEPVASNGTAVPPASDGPAPAPSMVPNGSSHGSTAAVPESEPAEADEQEIDEIDELDDDASESGKPNGGSQDSASEAASSSVPTPGSRKAILEEKRAEKAAYDKARKAEMAKARAEARVKNAGQKEAAKVRNELDEAIVRNNKKDDFVEREFRRYHGVTRARPLGKDRFFNRYWWLDGIGSMNLIGQGNGVLYGTGRMFIQGPTKEDWEYACEKGGEGEVEMTARRAREDVDPEATLQVNEWAFYEEEEEIEALLAWLNSKGTRELALKNAIAKWRPYILAGSRRRQNDTAKPFQNIDARRSTRSKGEPELSKSTYLNYQNKLSKI